MSTANNKSVGCGHCKPCIRIRTLTSVGRKPDHAIDCVYRHIFDTIDSEHATNSPGLVAPCGSDCPWVSMSPSSSASASGSSSASTAYDEERYFRERLDPAVRLIRKRVQYSKRRSVK